MIRKMTIGLAALAICATPLLAQESWPALTGQERTALFDSASTTSGDIAVACAKRQCSALATEIEDLLRKAGWTVTSIRRGGLGIDGVTGLRLSGCGKIADLAKFTKRPVEVIVDPQCGPQQGRVALFLIIGELPF